MKYLVSIGGRTVEVDLRGTHPFVDGEPLQADLRTVPGTGVRHLVLDGGAHTVIAERGTRKGSWRITLNGRTLDVEALDERTRAIREMAGAAAVETAKVVTAPMPGMVVRISVEVGQHVSAGQAVAVVEAMKMENELKAPADGVVASVEAAAGQTVDKGAVLIVLE